MARELPIRNGRLTTDLDADGHRIRNLPPGEGFTQAQADWNQSDSTKPDFIKNKPTIPAPVTIDAALSATSTNPVQNKVVTAALAAKLSRAEAEAGFTEWVCEPSTYNGGTLFIRYNGGGGYLLYTTSDPDPEGNIGFVNGAADAVSLTFTNGVDWAGDVDLTATRTRLPTMADLAGKANTNDVQLTPVYSQTPTFSKWVCEPATYDGKTLHVVYGNEEWFLYADNTFLDPPETGDDTVTNLTFSVYGVTATRNRTDIIGYTLGDQTTKPLQPQGDYAVKSEMSVTPGTGDVTIQLKSGMSATVLTNHQSWSDVKPSGGIPKTDLASAVQASLGKADTALQSHQSLAGLMPKYAFSDVQTISSAGTEQSPNKVALADAQNKRVSVTAAGAYISVAALATASDGIIRDMMLTLDCSTLSEGDEPHVTFANVYKGADDDANNLVADAGAVNVYYVTEYAPNAFLVAKQAIGGGT